MSKQCIMRLCLIVSIIGAAALFDVYHSSHSESLDASKSKPEQNDTESGKVAFCYQVSNTNVKTAANEFTVRFRLTFTQNKYLLRCHNLRTFQIMKAEFAHSFFPVLCPFHSLPFNRVIYTNPGDTPPWG